jgi:hypothetical protein
LDGYTGQMVELVGGYGSLKAEEKQFPCVSHWTGEVFHSLMRAKRTVEVDNARVLTWYRDRIDWMGSRDLLTGRLNALIDWID